MAQQVGHATRAARSKIVSAPSHVGQRSLLIVVAPCVTVSCEPIRYLFGGFRGTRRVAGVPRSPISASADMIPAGSVNVAASLRAHWMARHLSAGNGRRMTILSSITSFRVDMTRRPDCASCSQVVGFIVATGWLLPGGREGIAACEGPFSFARSGASAPILVVCRSV